MPAEANPEIGAAGTPGGMAGLPTDTPPRWMALGGRSLAIVLAIGALVPLAPGHFLALMDLPYHASQVALWQAYSTDPVVRAHYTLHPAAPYAAVYYLWRGLMEAGLSLPDAGRVTTLLLILAMPPSFLLLLAARRRPLDGIFFLFAMVYLDALAWGFLPFYLSLPVLFVALAGFSWWVGRPSLGRALLVLASGLLLLWSHALTVALWGASCGLLAMLEPRAWRQRLKLLLPLLPVGLLLALWTSSSASVSVFQYRTAPWTRLARIGGYLFSDFVTEPVPLYRVGLLAAFALVILGCVDWRRHPTEGRSWAQVDGPLLGVGLAAFAVFLFIPDGIDWTSHLNTRFLAPALLLIIAALPAPRLPPMRTGIALLLAVGVVSQWRAIARATSRYDAALGDAAALFRAFPLHSSVVRPQGTDEWLPPWTKPILDHLAAWAEAYCLGPSQEFPGNNQALVRESATQAWPRYDARIDRLDPQHWVVQRGNGALPDYLLFYAQDPPPEELAVAGEAGRFRLWRRTGGLTAYQRSDP